ncbi:MAG: outer membrane protein assembly factor BamB family protein [Planctomycetota bacterium]|jgi:parallel beta-helix repeat protein
MAVVSNPKIPLVFVLSLFLGFLLLNPSSAIAQSLNWNYQTGGIVYSSPAVGSDGTIYIGSADSFLYALNSDGTLKWRYQTGDNIFSSPAIGSDETIYVGSNDHYLYALNPDGTLKWRYRTGGIVYSSPAIDFDGTIYVGSNDKYIYALNPDGTRKWRYQTGGFVFSSPAVDPDGNIYTGSYDYYFYALNADGTLKWRHLTGGEIFSSPAIASDGTIYVGSWDKHLYALNSDGTLKWKFQTDDFVDSSPAIDSDGTIYVGSYDMHLYAINPNGTLKWKFNTGNFVGSSPAIGSTASNGIPLFNQGNDKVIFVGSGEILLALKPDGTKKWEFSTGDPSNFNDSSPTISSGKVICGASNGNVNAVNYEGGSLASADWPKIFNNIKNTAMAFAGIDVALPTLTLGGEGYWSGCPDELPGEEVTILSFSLLADDVDSWKVDSIRFESSGSGNEYEAIEELRLYQENIGNSQLLTRDNYVDDDETITLIPEKIIDIPRGQTVNLRLAYKFRKRAMQECTARLDFRVRTRPDWITARPVSNINGSKAGKEIEGIIAFGCVININTNKIFSEIHEAVDDKDTKDGHTIIVCPGTYIENVVVTKNNLTIRSRDGRDVTIVQAAETSQGWNTVPVFQIIGNNNTIDGFTLKSAHKQLVDGECIRIDGKGNKIVNNTITDSPTGIKISDCKATDSSPNLIQGNDIIGNADNEGVTLNYSTGTKIINNTISGYKIGIELSVCEAPNDSTNVIENNYIHGNRSYGDLVSCGVRSHFSFGTVIVNNTLKNNGSGIYLEQGKTPKDSLNLIEANRMIENVNDGIQLLGASGTEIVKNNIGQNGRHGIFLRAGKTNLIQRNDIVENSKNGVELEGSSNNLIIDNIIRRNCRGINISDILTRSDNNRIYGNDIQNSECSQTGIHLDGSNSEIIGNTISDDAGDGIMCENGANPTIRKNNITNNTGFGLNNMDESVNIDAQENWWGDASGPAGAGPGTGNGISENVDFSNWRTEPVALVVTSSWDVHGAKGTDVTAMFYVTNLSDSNDTYHIDVSDTLGWGLYPTTLTETVTAGQSNQILISVSIPLDALNATENEIILTATSTTNPTITDSATLKVIVGEIWMLIDDFSFGAPPLTVTNNEGVFPLKDGMTVQSPMILGGEFDTAINLLSADLGNGASMEIRGGSLHYTQDTSCTAVLVFHYDGNDGSWEEIHASMGLGGGIDITNGGTYDRIRVKFLNNISSFVMGAVLFKDQDNSSEAKMTIPVSAEPFTVEYLFEGLVHQGNGADLTNVRTILFLAGSGGGMTGLMDFEIDDIWAIPAE